MASRRSLDEKTGRPCAFWSPDSDPPIASASISCLIALEPDRLQDLDRHR